VWRRLDGCEHHPSHIHCDVSATGLIYTKTSLMTHDRPSFSRMHNRMLIYVSAAGDIHCDVSAAGRFYHDPSCILTVIRALSLSISLMSASLMSFIDRSRFRRRFFDQPTESPSLTCLSTSLPRLLSVDPLFSSHTLSPSVLLLSFASSLLSPLMISAFPHAVPTPPSIYPFLSSLPPSPLCTLSFSPPSKPLGERKHLVYSRRLSLIR
jgi:hypothetical protein